MRLARLEIATESNIGRKRRNNEDFHRVSTHQTPLGSVILLAVADGMGGAEAGEVASKLAIESITEATRSYALHLSSGRSPIKLDQVMDKALKLAQRRVVLETQRNSSLKGMGTTLTAVLITEWNRTAVIGHVGDTRAYRYSSGRWTLLTEDHSWVAQQVRHGALTETQADEHPWRNMLTQAIGLDDVKHDVVVTSFAPGEVLMLCTDGLHGLVGPSEWVFDSNLQASLEAWVGKALMRGGTDNITAVTARFK